MKIILLIMSLFIALPTYVVAQSLTEAEGALQEAQAGNAGSAYKYADHLRKGIGGVDIDYKEAARWYKIAAQRGNTDAAIELAQMYEMRLVPNPKPMATKELYQFAYRTLKAQAETGDRNAMTRIGIMHMEGHGLERSESKAIEWFEKGIEKGDAKAMLLLGKMVVWNTTPNYTYEQGIELLYKAAQSGLTDAWHHLALTYSGAQGDRVNYERAIEAFRKAHESGKNPEATRMLGICYITGLGVEKDERKGAQLIIEAAKNGNDKAMMRTARLYRYGIGVPVSKSKEISWLKKAVKLNEPDAHYFLGLAYRDGAGVNRNKKKALEHLKKAQEKKHYLASRDYYALKEVK